MKKGIMPYAVVLDIGFAGYGILRSLADYNIPLIGFKSEKFYPEAGTRLCKKIYTYRNYDHLKELLVGFAKSQSEKPLLYLTSDNYVDFVVKSLPEVLNFYNIDFPEAPIVDLLLDKLRFSDFALKNNILIPATFDLTNISDPYALKDQLSFPAILKPWLRTDVWKKNIKTKAFLLQSFDEFASVFNKVSIYERNLLIQQYIAGSDENVYYCLTYFDSKSNCLAAFTGQKIRQWPVQTGSTATTKPVENEMIRNETLRIFKLLNYKGFGSVEFKKNNIDGKYYVMEPTVGRLNQQEYVATLNGTNIPLIAYNSVTGLKIQPKQQKRKQIIYIDEANELRSVFKLLKTKQLTINKWLRSIQGKKAYRYFNKKDPYVFINLLLWPIAAIIKKLK
jgi:predicted ATP-grasp superfamily ATP-dependent carboligase